MSEPTVSPVAARLKELGIEDDIITKIENDLGATTVEDLGGLTEDDLVGVGMKKLPARKLAASLKPATTPAPATTEAPAAVTAVSFDAVLPPVPSDESWLQALKIGGVLKIDQSSVIGAIRAALAHRAGLFGIPERIVEMMERFADENEEPVDSEYFKLRRLLTRRTYAEVFEAIDGLDGSYVTEARKRQLLGRIDGHLWPAISGFYDQLKSWQEAWMAGAANPAMMMNAILAASGGGLGMMPPGMMAPPDTGALRDYADAVNDAANKVFAGPGVQIAAALAYDATRVREIIQNPRLPTLTGAANRDQMIRQLGVAVPATYPRLETNLTRFVLSILKAKDVPAGNEELQYFGTLFMLGSQIPWNELGASGSTRPTGIGGNGNPPRDSGRRTTV